MSPEYVMGGRFSEKSDVFSFGVLVLEIVSGEKISGFQNDKDLNLLGYVSRMFIPDIHYIFHILVQQGKVKLYYGFQAWRLWCEDKVLNLIDQSLEDSFCPLELKRCVNVGLLCIQENPTDRPNMPGVILQLTGGTDDLPKPKQPAFVFQTWGGGSHGSNSDGNKSRSVNEVTLSAIDGR